MTITVLLILFAGLALLLFVTKSFRAATFTVDEDELNRRIRPVDLESFQNLTDPAEEAFLRDNLPAREFRGIQRQRLWAALEYVGGVSHNAGVLLQIGQAARRSSDKRIAEAGRSLVDEALRLRLFSTLAMGKLSLQLVFPATAWQTAGLADRYQQLREEAVQLGRLQYPSRAGLLSRSL